MIKTKYMNFLTGAAILFIFQSAQAFTVTRYIDANDSNTMATGGTPDPFYTTALTRDNLWRKRPGFGFDVNGNTEIFEKDGAPGGFGDAAPLETTIDGLTPGQEYGVFVCYLSDTTSWVVRAGLAANNLTEYNPIAPAGLVANLGTTSVPGSNRKQLLGFVGNVNAAPDGTIVVYIDDGESTSNAGERTWYEGVAVGPPAIINPLPEAYCRFVPERSDDFAWENDKVAFRTYGPALRNTPEDSGIDCWLKRVNYPIIDKWYQNDKKGISYHVDHGEGYDPYHVASSRGCGGLGLWINDQLVTSNTFTEWEILHSGPTESSFILTYDWQYQGDYYKELKHITIKLGDRLFKSASTFWKNDILATNLPIAIGITTHNGRASISQDISAGWMTCWETIDGYGLGTGVVMDPSSIISFQSVESAIPDKSHALLITQTDTNGQVIFHTGYGWEKAEEITTSDEWNTYMANSVHARKSLPIFDEAVELVRRANDYWIANKAFGNAGWANSTYYTGNQRAFRITGETAYLERALGWANSNRWKVGPESSSNAAADSQLCGQTYVDLYRLDSQPIRITEIESAIFALVNNPEADDDWWWIDAFFMAAPVFTKLGVETNDPDYFKQMLTMYNYMKTTRGLYDVDAGLWYRDPAWIHPKHTTRSGGKIFWSRGNGWVLASLARIINEIPETAPERVEMVDMFQTMCAVIKPLQGDDGMWRSSLLASDDFPNPETSGTALFTYSMAWGVRNGLLDPAEYTNTLAKAWHGLTTIALKPNGLVGYVQRAAFAPGHADPNETHDYGVGAFLLAGTEVSLLAADSPSVSPWAGPDEIVVNSNGDEQKNITLDATATEIYRGTANNYIWWANSSPIATGITAQVTLPQGTNTLTLKISHSDGKIYEDSVIKTVISVIPNAGSNQVIWDTNGDESANAILDASGTIGTILSYSWWLGDIWLASGSNTQVSLPLGHHEITLKTLDIREQVFTSKVVKYVTPSVITTASTYEDGNPPEYATDNDLNTRWSADGNGQWINFDMGSTKTVMALHCAFHLGNTRKTSFTVKTSLNGTDWTIASDYQSSGTTLDRERFNLPSPTEARHIRIIGQGNSSNTWNSYSEITIEAQSSMEDTDADTLPDRWEEIHFGNLTGNADTHSDTDSLSDGYEYIAGADPNDELDFPELLLDRANDGTVELNITTRAALGPGYSGLERRYAIEKTTNLTSGVWTNLDGWHDIFGDNLTKTVELRTEAPTTLYRLRIWLQPRL